MKQDGVLLIELLIVIMIIGILVAGAVKTWDTVIVQTRFNKTTEEMQQIVYAIVGNPELISEGRRTDFGYIGDMGVLPDSLVDLAIKPSGASDTCWRGPYLRSKFADNQDDFLHDAWGNRYIYDKDSLVIISYASGTNLTPDKWINMRIAKSDSVLLRNAISGYIKDLTGNVPGFQFGRLRVYITYPYNGNLWTPIGYIPQDGSGFYQIPPDIPQGNHRIKCIYYETNMIDTVDYMEKFVCVYPGIPNTVDFKLSIKFE